MKSTDAKKTGPAQKAALVGMLAAVTLALSFIERALCAALPLPPGVRPGLSNIAVMFTCVALGLPYAMGLIVIKAGFILLVSGAYAGFISLCGGVLSVLGFWALTRLKTDRLTYTGISAVSAVLHNAGQLAAASLTVGSALYLWMAPVLLVSGVAFGLVTGVALNAALPSLIKMIPYINKTETEETGGR